MKRILGITLMMILSALLLEAVLRIQQACGPLYDLEFADQTLERCSPVLNHRRLPEESWTLEGEECYGEYSGYTFTMLHDENGVRRNPLRPEYPAAEDLFKILCVGDSFVEGYADSTTLPQHVWEYLRQRFDGLTRIRIDNVGCSSYSPAIYIPQVKQLVPRLQPDLVVVVIDESDLGDDYLRYRNLIVRDAAGRNIAVRASPLLVEFNTGFERIRRSRLYLTRVVRKIWHTWVYMPAFRKGYRSWHAGRWILGYSRDKDPDARHKYKAEIDHFEANLAELMTTLTELLGDGGRVLFVCHPHVQHLVPDSDGWTYNSFVSSAVAKVAAEQKICYYAAAADLLTAAAGDPARLYWRENDMHFNFDGMRIYGGLIATQLEPMVRALLTE
ncbi:MAG: SGNH/GDSL hydrolase family protein [bacterium]